MMLFLGRQSRETERGVVSSILSIHTQNSLAQDSFLPTNPKRNVCIDAFECFSCFMIASRDGRGEGESMGGQRDGGERKGWKRGGGRGGDIGGWERDRDWIKRKSLCVCVLSLIHI